MSIDWHEIRNRLAEAQTALERGASRSPEEAQALLKARARSLAREPARADENGESIQVLEFRLAAERYAVELERAGEVHPLKDFVPLPGAPAFVPGIVNVRGQVLPVVDLKRFFELPDKGLGEGNRVIVVRHGREEICLIADAVAGIRSLPAREIQPPLPTLTGIRNAYLKGVTGDGMAVLDAAKLLADENLTGGERAAAGE